MATQDERPKVLLINLCKDTATNVLQGILGACCENSASGNADIKEHVLKIDNKYYTADVSVFSVSHMGKEFEDMLGDAEALVISFEMKNESTISEIKAFGNRIKDLDIEIKILLSTETEICSGLDERRKDILEWCIDNSFELVDSYQTDDNEEYPEKFGFERVKEALHTHMWPNMIEKSKTSNGARTEEINCANGETSCNGNHEHQEAADPIQQRNNSNCEAIDSLVDGTESEGESFEEMFAKLHEMKLHASSLPDDQRREYAEKMAIAFWKAMGQDDDEISGL